MRKSLIAIAVVGALSLHARAGDDGKRPSAEEGFKAIQEVAKGSDAESLEAVFPANLQGSRMKAEEVRKWRAKFARELAAATPVRAREDGTEAVARFSTEDSDQWELALHFTGTRWVVASPGAYLVKGRSLDAARGPSPAKTALIARTEEDRDYAKSAFSFAHVTGDPALCLNRMDLWFDGNCGQLHAGGDDKVATLTAKTLESLDGIPTGVTWGDAVVPEKGRVFVVHCVRSGTVDFYVACRVVKVAGARVDLEWTLLAAGLGSPATIQKTQPLNSNDGADGCDGMCGKSGK